MRRTSLALFLVLAGCAKPSRPVPQRMVSPAMASVAVAPLASALPAPELLPDRQFAFQVEQRGQVVPVTAHAVSLRREPFTFAFAFRPEGRIDLFVNASFEGSTLELARSRRPYRELRGFLQASRIGQPPNNELRELYVSELGPNQWISNPAAPRPYGNFDAGCAKSREGSVCRYTVEQLMEFHQNEAWRPLREVTEAKLFLVFFLSGAWTDDDLDNGDRPERDRDWLTIAWLP